MHIKVRLPLFNWRYEFQDGFILSRSDKQNKCLQKCGEGKKNASCITDFGWAIIAWSTYKVSFGYQYFEELLRRQNYFSSYI